MTDTATVSAPASEDLRDVHIVLRTSGFVANGIQRERGEVLVTKGWRNHQALVNQRFLGTADYDLNETMVTCACDRRWVNQLRADDHACPARKG